MRVKSRFTSRYQSRYQSRFVAGLDGPSGSTGVPQPYVIAPSVTSPADAATDITETPTITSSAFSVANGGSDTHATSDWQIASDSGFNTIVVQSADDATNKTSWTVPGGNLEVDTTYYVRVRHTGTTYGDSAWSSTISFTTAASFAYSWTNTEGSDFEAQADGTGWDDTYRAAVDQLISDLKSGQINGSNVYSGFDRILLMDAPNQADSLRYLNAPTVTAAAVNSPTFTATEGFAGNGSSMYIDLNFTPSTDGSQFALNSASAAVWMRTANTQSFGTALGGYGSASSQLTGIPLWTSGAGNVGAQGPSSSTRYTATSTAATGFTGLMGINRSGASAQQIYVDGAADGTASNSSTALSTAGLHLFRENRNGTGTNYANGQMSLAFVGRSFTANEWADIYDAFNRYRTAREAA